MDPEIFQRFPGYAALVVVAEGLDASAPTPEVGAELRAAAEAQRQRLQGTTISEHPRVKAWRQAYSAFGCKPSRYRSSIEQLLRRAVREDVPSINALVDAYNTVSLLHMLPVGGEDLDNANGSHLLTIAEGDETFDAASLESESEDPVRPGEVIWRDGDGVTCRRWNWRQSARTILTEETKNAYFIIDCLPPTELDDGVAAAEDLSTRLSSACPDASLQTVVVTADGVRAS